MALKDTLLAASLGATMVAGTNTEAKETTIPPMAPQQVQNLSPAEIKEMNFQKNYRYLYKNVDGAWFSFGDEKKMRQALYDIGSFPMGREVIAGIPENMEFGSTNFMPPFEGKDQQGNVTKNTYGGVYNFTTNSLVMNTDLLQDNIKSDDLINNTEALFHELLHAYQKKQGLILLDNASVDESVHSQMLIEAEAIGWNLTLAATRAFTSGDYYMDPFQVRAIMQADLISFARHKTQKEGKTFNEKEFKENDFTYQLQQSLIACKGNYDLAQKKMVGQCIKHAMTNKFKKWKELYENQAVTGTENLLKDKKISKNGNPAAYQKMLKYYQDRYGLTPSDIKLTLNAFQQNRVNDLKRKCSENTVPNLQALRKNTGR